VIIACPTCKARYRVDEGKIPPNGARLRCARCNGVFIVKQRVTPPLQPAPILIAHDSEAIRRSLVEIFSRSNISVAESRDGVEAFMYIQKFKPKVAILDVALPKMFGFEVCEVLKREEEMKGVRVILLASAYDRTRLRRRPENLYGADGYLEKHEIQEGLLPLVQRFLSEPAEGAPAPPPEPQQFPSEKPPEEPSATAPEEPAVQPHETGYTEEQEKEIEKAQRLARIIVSDIALYNKDLVEEGVKTGQFFQLLERDIKEGRELYIARVPEWIRERTDYLEESLQNLIETKKKEMEHYQ